MAREWAATHGTLSCYKRGCRQPECQAANRRYDQQRRRNLAYGRPTTKLIDAEPVRQHVLTLKAAGLSVEQQSKLAKVPKPAIQRLLYGLQSQGRPPVKSMDPKNALPLLALTATIDTLPLIARIPPDGTRRRALAMAAIGHPLSWQAAEVSQCSRHYWEATLRNPKVTVDLARRVRDLYDRTWDRPAEDTHVTRRTARWARSQGGLLPMELDDDLIDLPEADLQAELARRVAAMDDAELRRCASAYKAEGDRTPLISAAARVWRRRLESAA